MCFNNKEPYLIQAKVALKSIELNFNNIPISLYLVNFDTHTFKAERCINVKLDDLRCITSYSLLAMYDTMLKCKTDILWLDVDVIIRANLQGIFLDVKPNTLKLLYRKDHKNHTKFNTGVVAVGYSNSTLAMMKWCSEKATDSKLWYGDQLYLYKAYEKYKDKVELVEMDHIWNDLGGRKNSFAFNSNIWHCKSSHFNESPYKEEYNHYKKMAEKYKVEIEEYKRMAEEYKRMIKNNGF